MNKKIISLIAALAIGCSMLTAYADNETTVTTDTIATESEDAQISTESGGTVRLTANDDGTVDVEIESDDTLLVEGVDYTLTYENNVNAGTGTVIITFMGNYTGVIRKDFTIKKTSSSSSSGASSSSTSTTTKIEVVDSDGNKISTSNHVTTDTVTITLPKNYELSEDKPYTITVTNGSGNAKEDITVILKDSTGDNSAKGVTDSDGKVTLPVTPDSTVTPDATAIPTIAPTEAPEDVHTAYIYGYEDGTFRPDGNITRAETAAMLSRVMTFTDKEINVAFSDVNDDIWYSTSINVMSSAGIVKGYTDGTFRPDNTITRAEFVTMLMRNMNVESFEALPFDDVSADIWSADYIYSAYSAGYINGYEDGSFRPDSPITRAEAVKIINGVLDRSDFSNDENPFTDVKTNHWAYKHILEAAVEHAV